MKKLLSTVAAIVIAGGIAAYSASLTPLTGPQDPSQLNATINQLMRSINLGVNGIVASSSAVINSTATTAEQNLYSVAIPANTLAKSGQALRLRCTAIAQNAHTNTIKLYYGTSSISSGAVSSTGGVFDLQLLVTYNASATSSNYVGIGKYGIINVSNVATSNSTDNMASALNARCTATQGTASAADVTLVNFLVEQIK